MKVLFVGPYPPPHGGISVHVWSAHALMKRAGLQSNVLNVDPRAPESDAYIKISGARDLARELLCHVRSGWALRVHTNGHNFKSWAIAFVCALAAQLGPAATLTLHSGIAPTYMRNAPAWLRCLMRFTCALYEQVICVNEEISTAVADLGVPRRHIQITPAYVPIEAPDIHIPAEIEGWLIEHSPVLAATLFFRPEYGFEVLVEAARRLRELHPRLGCLVIGSGEEGEAASALVEACELKDTVFFAGDLDHELCLALMSRSDVFVRPTHRDGDSISVREALALGVPVVASNVGTRPKDVVLFEPGDVNALVDALRMTLDDDRKTKETSPDVRKRDRASVA